MGKYIFIGAIIVLLIFYWIFIILIPLFANKKSEVEERRTVRLVKLDKILKESESLKSRKEELRGETDETQEKLNIIKENLNN